MGTRPVCAALVSSGDDSGQRGSSPVMMILHGVAGHRTNERDAATGCICSQWPGTCTARGHRRRVDIRTKSLIRHVHRSESCVDLVRTVVVPLQDVVSVRVDQCCGLAAYFALTLCAMSDTNDA